MGVRQSSSSARTAAWLGFASTRARAAQQTRQFPRRRDAPAQRERFGLVCRQIRNERQQRPSRRRDVAGVDATQGYRVDLFGQRNELGFKRESLGGQIDMDFLA